MPLNKNTDLVKQLATQLGFSYCGIAQATQLGDDAKKLEKWLKQNNHGTMQYMERNFDKRIDPRLLVPDAKSIITLMLNYYPKEQIENKEIKISKYAYGKDYHLVIKEKLHQLLFEINSKIGAVSGRGFVDSAPVLERAWAVKSGIGWVGKNGNLITKKNGSFFFIATLIVDLPLLADNEFVKDYCGTCTACIDACPTNAILPNKIINGSNCISYYTIELKDAIINTDKNFDNWMFGCDTCQDVCPWNKFSKPHNTTDFNLPLETFNFSTKDWLEIEYETFNKIFRDSPFKRSKFEGIKRNIKFIQSQKVIK